MTGSDSNPGTFEQPWKTLAKAAATAKVATGAGVYIKCGITYRERLVLSTTQLQNGSIVAGYGNCSATSKAVISGADDFSGGWTKSGNIWSRRVPTTSAKITQLFINGVAQRTAQFPNFGGLGHEYSIANRASPSTTASLLANPADIATLAAQDIVGASISVREEPWFIEKRGIKAFDKTTGTMTLDTPTSYNMEGGDGYVLSDKLWMLDAPGEFFHDKANGVLYVYPSTTAMQTALNGALIEGSVRGNAVDIGQRSNLVMRNIAAVKTQSEALSLSNVAGMLVDQIDVSDNGGTGMRTIYASDGTIVQNSTFSRNAFRAIDTPSARVTYTNNVITDTGVSAYSGPVVAALTNGPGGVVDNNIFRRSGYAAVNYSGTGGSTITRNYVEDSCTRLGDGGAIYSWNGGNNTTNQSSLIENNIIVRVLSNSEGGGAPCAGVYADDLSRQGVIRGNTVIDSDIGILIHNASYMTVDSNKVWLARLSGVWINMDHTDRDTTIGNVYRNNQFNVVTAFSGAYPQAPVARTSQAIDIWHTLSGAGTVTSGGGNSFSNNQMLMLNGTSQSAAAQIRGGSTSGVTRLSADAWRKMNPAELPVNAPVEYAGYLASFGPEMVTNTDYANNASGWSSWFAAATPKGSLSLAAATGCIGTCAVFNAGTIYDVLATPNFAMNSGALHMLKFRASLQTDGAVSQPNVSAAAEVASPTTLSGVTGNTIRYQGFFNAKSAATGHVNLTAQAGTKVGFDSVSVKQITVYTLARPSDFAAYVSAQAAPKVVDCAALGWPTGCKVTDTNGVAVTLPFTLPANSAKLLLRSDSALKVTSAQ